MSFAEQYRELVLKNIFDVASFAAGWPARQAHIMTALGPPAGWDARNVVGLGSQMRDMFVLGAPPPGSGRSQAALSSAGTVWEALVTYYLNLCYAGTDTVAIRKSEVPACVADALSVWSGATRLAADVDAMVLHLPGLSGLPRAKSKAALKRDIETVFSTRFADATVVVLGCKTTWADSIQTPMLWNMLYGLRRQRVPVAGGFSIGSGAYSLDGLAGFSYCFVTVPSQNPSRYLPHHSSVKRAETMSGGHYWGLPTARNIAPSLAEFFGRQAGTVRITPPAEAGKALAAEGRTPSGLIDLSAFGLP